MVVAFVAVAIADVVLIIAWWSAGAARASGVRGRVWLGPLTAVERLGGPPDEHPYAATSKVLAANGRVVTMTCSTKSLMIVSAGQPVSSAMASTA